jgi:hypothetical protein
MPPEALLEDKLQSEPVKADARRKRRRFLRYRCNLLQTGRKRFKRQILSTYTG